MQFDANWFARHQRALVCFANTAVGRHLLGIEKMKVRAIEPHSVSGNWKKVGDKIEKTTVIYAAPRFSSRLRKVEQYLKAISGAALLSRLAAAPHLLAPSLLALGTDTFNPATGTGGTSVDGWVRWQNFGNDTFANARTNAGTGSAPAAATGDSPVASCAAAAVGASKWFELYRVACLFDTSSLPVSDVISSASFSFEARVKYTDFTDSLSLVTCTPGSNGTLVNSDYNIANWGSTKQATDVTVAGLTVNVYTDMSLNATGISNVTKGGITKFGLRLTSDNDASEPSTTTAGSGGISITFADAGGNIPKLTVTHAAPPDLGGTGMMLGI